MMGQTNFGQNGQQPGGSGSSGQAQTPPNPFGQQMDPTMMRMFFPDIFGEPVRESIYEDAVFAGSITVQGELEIGTFSVMVLKPDAQNPKAAMVVRTNGSVQTDPARLKRIGDAFLRWAKDEERQNAFAAAQSMESGAQSEALTAKVVEKSGGL